MVGGVKVRSKPRHCQISESKIYPAVSIVNQRRVLYLLVTSGSLLILGGENVNMIINTHMQT